MQQFIEVVGTMIVGAVSMRAAISWFQSDSGIEPTGVMTDEDRAFLREIHGI